MSKKQKEKTAITISGKKYFREDMTSEQNAIVNHIHDLDRKIQSSQFNLEQLQFGRNAFMEKLNESLESKNE